MSAERRKWMIWGAFLMLTLTWGSSFMLVKRALQGGFSAYEVASTRMMSAMLILIFPALFCLRKIPTGKLGYLFVSALLSMFFPAYLFSTAQVHIHESSLVSILNALTPASTFIIGIEAFRQPMRAMQAVGLVVGFLGTALLIMVNSSGELSLNEYAFLVLLATMCYGTNVNLVKTKLIDVPTFYLSAVTVAIAGMSSLALMLWNGSFPHLIQNSYEHPWSFGAMFLLGAMGTALSQLVFNALLQLTTPVFASAITYFIPIVAIFWGLLDGEYLSIVQIVGMGLVIGGIYILNKNK